MNRFKAAEDWREERLMAEQNAADASIRRRYVVLAFAGPSDEQVDALVDEFWHMLPNVRENMIADDSSFLSGCDLDDPADAPAELVKQATEAELLVREWNEL